ncbi:hypothetical protein M0804_003274 [Polistes exclamans]|nr:hypothetical protein M0804_003274 [Polistes exclamans]
MMDDEASIFWASILMVCGSVMMVILLTCYICLFRDLCCPAGGDSTKRRRTIRRNTMQVTEENNLQKFDEIPMNEITQGDSSMPTESEKF